MDVIETKVVREEPDADRRLSELGLNRTTLLEVRDVAISSGANATPFHPANAAGTFSYQDGTWAIRDRLVGPDWKVDRLHSVEAIKNEKLNIRIAFSNVDIACNDDQGPKPRSAKGAGTERVCSGNLFGNELKHYAPRQPDGCSTYYLMVDEHGAAELTMPVVKGGTFKAFVERIYLSDGSDLNPDRLPLDDGDRADDFDPLVARK